MKKYIIVKFGGSVITYKKSYKRKTLNLKALNLVCKEVAGGDNFGNIIIVHGGGSFAHPVAKKYNLPYYLKYEKLIPKSILLDVYFKIKIAMEELNEKVVSYLIKNGVPAKSFHPSDFCITNSNYLMHMDLSSILLCLEMGETPVLHGDIVQDKRLGASLLSSDQILAYLAAHLPTSRVIVGTDVDGLYTTDPKKYPLTAKRIEVLTPSTFTGLNLKFSELSIDATGGMHEKVRRLLELAQNGIESIIVDITKKGVLSGLIKGKVCKEHGTIVKCTKQF